MIFHRIDAVKREWRKQSIPDHRLPHGRHFRGYFVSQQVPAQSRLCALGIFEFHHGRMQDGLFSDTEQSGGHLSDDMIGKRNQFLGVSAFAGAGQSI
jgi:hypothetical protein